MPPPTMITSIVTAYSPHVRPSPRHQLRTDSLEGREFNVEQLALYLVDAADVDVVHHLTGRWVYRHRAARAFPRRTLHRRHQHLAAGRALGLAQRLVDQVHAVIATYDHEVRARALRL